MVEIAADTPLFDGPSPTANVVGIIGADTRLRSLEQVSAHPPRNPYFRNDLPLTFVTTFHRVALPDGTEAWLSPDLLAERDYGIILPRMVPDPFWLGFLVPLFAALATLSLVAVKRGWIARAFAANAPLGPKQALPLVGCLLLFHLLVHCWMRTHSGCVVPALTDEFDYFRIANDILHRVRPTTWNFNISIAILYVPLMVLTEAKSYLDIHAIVVFLNVAILTPATSVMIYFLVEKVSRRPRVALGTVLALVLLPVVYYPVELHRAAAPVFKAFFGLPSFSAASYRLYYHSVWVGWNGLSDTASTFAVTLSLCLAVFLKGHRLRYHLLVGAAFGLACFLRINNIFFAPVVAYLLWQRAQQAKASIPQILGRAGLAVAAFAAIVAPQFIANTLQFGDPLTFPYVFHANHASDGFEWSWVPYSTHFLMGTNWLHMAAGATGLLLLRRTPAGRFLALWSIPLILFFCGYTVTAASPIRFTLSIYAPLWAAFLLAVDRHGVGRHPALTWGIAALNAFLVCPIYRWQDPQPLFLEALPAGRTIALVLTVAIPLLSLAAILVGLRGRSRGFWLTALILYHAGWWALFPLLFLGVLGCALWDWVDEVRSSHLLPCPSPETEASAP
jgi:hypothetical protein